MCFFFFFQAEDGIRDYKVTGVQTCALPISVRRLAFEGSYEQYLGGTTFGAGAMALRVGRFDWGVGAQALGDASLSAADLLGVSSLVFRTGDRKSTRLNSSHLVISYAVFCLKK